jgi:multidrug transporter EmrE-like cation transporter
VQQSWQSTVIALGFIAFAGLGLYLAVSSNNFSTVWAGIGTVVGVLTGAIPSYFFKQQADAQIKKATAFAGAMDHVTYQKLIDDHPEFAQ